MVSQDSLMQDVKDAQTQTKAEALAPRLSGQRGNLAPKGRQPGHGAPAVCAKMQAERRQKLLFHVLLCLSYPLTTGEGMKKTFPLLMNSVTQHVFY